MNTWITITSVMRKSDIRGMTRTGIPYLDRVVVKDDGYEVVFKAGVTVEVEI